jgi:DNA mismatch endonuclease, patch repair protein
MRKSSNRKCELSERKLALRTDVLTPAQRSHCMSQIRGRDTKPELLLRKALWVAGKRYRIRSRLPGRPDLVFPKAKVAVFVDGCQWHCCPVHFVRPKSNQEFWDRKFERNRLRDEEVNRLLAEQNWRVFRFWEHEVEADCSKVVRKIDSAICTEPSEHA